MCVALAPLFSLWHAVLQSQVWIKEEVDSNGLCYHTVSLNSNKALLWYIPGASILPEANMHFYPPSDFPPISEKFLRLRRKFSQFYLFRKILPFSSSKISDDFFCSSTTNVLFPPYFNSFSPFFSIFKQNSFSPYFCKFLSWFRKISVFFYILSAIFFAPYYDHDAFMHHTMHVLDGPAVHPALKYHCWQIVISHMVALIILYN